MTGRIVGIDASNYYYGNNAINGVSGEYWNMSKPYCARNTHNGVPVFDMENRLCYLRTAERRPFCNPSRGFGYTTADWIDWRDDSEPWRALHRGHLAENLVKVKHNSNRLGVYSRGSFRYSQHDIDKTGWQLVVAVGQDNDCDGTVDEDLPVNVCGRCGDVPEEMCNGQDDDCDGVVDDGTPDSDGDGFSDLAEYVSGTSPIDRDDYFSHSGTYHNNQFALHFGTKTGRTYSLKVSTDLLQWHDWTSVSGDDLEHTLEFNTSTHNISELSTDSGSYFFKIDVQKID